MSGQISARLTALVGDLRAAVLDAEPEVIRTKQSVNALQALAADVPLRRPWSDNEPAAPRQ